MFENLTSMLYTNQYVRVIALDFSKAFDSIRHSTLIDKYSKLNIPVFIHNWIVNFFNDRKHCTNFLDTTSEFKEISASVIQGSALGPPSFTVLASDLSPINSHNTIVKFADDTYLLIPSNQIETTEIELRNIESWSSINNLKLNKSKTYEILFHNPRSKFSLDTLPPPIAGISRVKSLLCLGVTLQDNFSFADHINVVINKCASSLYAIRILKAKGLNEKLIQTVFKATVLARLSYASQFSWGFANSSERDRLEAFLRKATRCNFFDGCITFEELVTAADQKLFNSILSNPLHVLRPLSRITKTKNAKLSDEELIIFYPRLRNVH